MENTFIQMTAVSTESVLSEPLTFTTTEVASKDNLSSDEAGLLSNNGTVFVETPRGFLLPSTDEVGSITYSSLTGSYDEAGNRLVHLPVQLFLPSNEEGSVEGSDYDNSVINKNIICIQAIDTDTPSTLNIIDEPIPKRKGGWPKGKKRKNTPEVNAPRGPLSGYVIYAIERRQQIKEYNPDLPFVEVTKILGQEWSNMSSDKKGKYLEEASADKLRYIEELKVFQQSETYKNYLLKKRKMKQANSEDAINGSNGSLDCHDNYNPIIDVEDDSVGELHCRVCNQYFSSLHNKKEHMFGRQHLQAITGDLEKELAQSQQNDRLSATQVLPGETTRNRSPQSTEGQISTTNCHIGDPVDMQSFIQNFLQKNSEREEEISCLRQTVKKANSNNLALIKEIHTLQEYQDKMASELKTSVNYHASLSSQVDGLKMVPTLFGVINF